MSNIMRNLSLAAVLALSVATLGCNDPNKKMATEDQTIQSLEDRIRQLEDQLAQARSKSDMDQGQIDALGRELERLRAQRGDEAAGWQAVPGGAMTAIEGTVLFDSGKADLKPSGRKALAAVAQAVKQNYSDREIYVFGHTDTDPIKVSKWKDNYELSCQRSLTVVRFLQTSGVGNYLAACGWGEHRPAADNQSAEARQANRRVEVYAVNRR